MLPLASRFGALYSATCNTCSVPSWKPHILWFKLHLWHGKMEMCVAVCKLIQYIQHSVPYTTQPQSLCCVAREHLIQHAWLDAIQTLANTASKSLLWPAPHRSGISSVSWLCVLSPMHNNVTISSSERDASFTPAEQQTQNQIMKWFSSFQALRQESKTSLKLDALYTYTIKGSSLRLLCISNVINFAHLWVSYFISANKQIIIHYIHTGL
jgi:hypothetical protein